MEKQTILLLSFLFNLYAINVDQIDSSNVIAWDARKEIERNGIKKNEIDSIQSNLELQFAKKILNNTVVINNKNNGNKVINPPIYYCGCGLGWSGKISIYFDAKNCLEIVLSCPNSKLQNRLKYDQNEFVVNLNTKIEEEIKEFIRKKRLEVFKDSCLWECERNN
jgi:hypothetical protein